MRQKNSVQDHEHPARVGRFLCGVLLFSLLLGCGGGSAGTGTGDSSLRIEGAVSDLGGSPVVDALVTVVETGESDKTDTLGAFAISTDPVAGDLTLRISKEERSAQTTISVPGEHGTISINVKFDDVRQIVETKELSVESKIVGTCDFYFENFRTIRQANPIPPGTICLLKVSVAAEGKPVPHVPIAIQYNDCKRHGEWTTVALGATLSGGNIGVAQIEFPFFDDSNHCIYRVVTPFGDNAVEPIITEIESLTAQ